jgi:glycerol-3-phosphate dehydrogenase
MAREAGLETPITEIIHLILYEGLAPEEGVRSLMTRRWRAEEE